MLKKHILLLLFFISQVIVSAQEKEDESKMIREIVKLEVDKTKFAPKPVAPPVVEAKGKKGKKNIEEPPPPPLEEGTPDTTNPFIPAPQAEVLKRAQNWYTLKNDKITKSNGTNSGKSVSCQLTFPYKQKVLNPENDVDGTISMDLIIDAKEGKYRYTIKNIKHKANKQGMSGGDIYLKVPECGSMRVTDKTWKLIRSEAFGNAQIVIDDLKTMMNREVADDKKDEW